MKIQKNKNKISEESQNALKNFRQKQINSNIKLHKILLALVILVNIGLLFFIFFYRSKITQIKNISITHTSNISLQGVHISNKKNSLFNRMANIAAVGLYGSFRFSFIFENREEFQKIKKIIYDYKKEVRGDIPNIDEWQTYFMYQGISDGDQFSVFMERISFFEGIMIVIHTESGEKFGIYHDGMIIPNDKNNNIYSDCTDVILFSFDNDKIYRFKGKNKSIYFNNEKFLSLGNDELIIYNDYFYNGGYINFPLKSFDFSNVYKNVLTKEDGKFDIRNIEVYFFF